MSVFAQHKLGQPMSTLCGIGLGLLLSGCVVQRGRDFGHWAQGGEPIALVHFTEPKETDVKTIRKLALFPVVGDMPVAALRQLNDNLGQEAQNYCPIPLVLVERDGKMTDYVRRENLFPMDGVFNSQEAARIGQLLGVTHVLCPIVRDHRLNPPQLLKMHCYLVDTAGARTILEMSALYDAGEQNCLMALDKHLRTRSSRQYTQSSLDIILRSPAEFGAFVSAQCMGTFADHLWGQTRPLKNTGRSSDTTIGN